MKSIDIIKNSIKEVNGQLKKKDKIIFKNEFEILGPKSNLDSLIIVNLFVAIEEKIKVLTGKEVNLLNECTICLEKYIKKEKIIELPCKHNFHAKCIKEWFEKDNKSCPNCRENII